MEEEFGDFGRIAKLVDQYEKSLTKSGELTTYFDSEDFEDIICFYVDIGKLKKARKALKHALNQHPTDEDIILSEVPILIEEDKAEEALERLDQINTPDDMYWRILRITALSDLNRLEEAQGLGERMVKEDSEPEAIAVEIADIFADNEQFEYALHFLKKGLAYSPQDVGILNQMAGIEAAMERYEDALKHLEQVLDLDSYSAHAWQTKAAIYVDLKRYDEALEAFDYAIAIHPTRESLHVARIKTLVAANRDEEAMVDVEQFAKDFPKMKSLAYQMHGDILFWREDFNGAVRAYKKGNQDEIFMPDSLIRYARAEYLLRHYANAVKIGEEMRFIVPDDLPLLELLADSYYALHLVQKATAIMRRCTQLVPDSQYYWLRYGCLLLDEKDLKQAYTAIHKAYKLNPESAFCTMMLAVVCYLKDDYRNMLKYYIQAVNADESMREKFYNLCPDASQIIESVINPTPDNNEK